MALVIVKLLLLALLALGTSCQESSPGLEELVRDLHLRLNVMSLEFHEQMEQLVTEQQLLRQSVEKLSWVVDRVDQSMKNIENNHDVVMRNLSHVTSQSDAIVVNQQFCANHDRLRDLYFETLPRCQGPPLPPVTTEPPPTTTQLPPTTTDNSAMYISCSTAPPISGVYNIMLNSGHLIQVFCEQILQGGGWAVFQRRMDGSVDFNRNFISYQNGFGNPRGEFWLGLENLHRLSQQMGQTELLVDMEDFVQTEQFMLYRDFAIGNWIDGYKFTIGNIVTGTAGDALSQYQQKQFVTYDQHGGSVCAEHLASGFWHFDCGRTCSAKRYIPDSAGASLQDPHTFVLGGGAPHVK
ncbi:hypothetical protein pipiens_016199 [Culex pipiens pipiens]|uniref:Fibrinogen C-terminal domain-containing protein n=1 Tax=Culex pipiens pipiens TaxID=38569 RepID=A0ABD1CMC0_CULPP